MKLLLDQQLSRLLVALLEPAFPGTTHVVLEGLGSASDEAVWQHARRGGFVLVTKDEDFHLLSFARGHPPKVVWLRSGNGPSVEVASLLIGAAATIEVFANDTGQSLLVLP